MVIVRKSKQTEFKEKLGTLEEVLKQHSKILTGEDRIVRYALKTAPEGNYIVAMCSNKWSVLTRSVVAWVYYDDKTKDLIFRLEDEEHLDVVKEFCKTYERKTLKDEPIIEY